MREPSGSLDYEAIYDTLTDTYDEDVFGILAAAHELALEQVLRHAPADGISAVCDVAVGTGRFMEDLAQRFPDASLSGLDISGRMLAQARRRLPGLQAFQADARGATGYVGDGSMELTIAHFVMSYVGPAELLSELNRLTAPGGICSLANSTYESLAAMQRASRRCLSEAQIRAHSDMPLTTAEMERLVAAAGFEVVDSATLRKLVRFESFEELRDWGLRSGFLTTFFESLPDSQVQALRQIAGVFPLEDHFQGTFIVGRKP
ncbi:MAG: class I SAM-dependent DNA methyltransferase [Chloroflexota bacterium]